MTTPSDAATMTQPQSNGADSEPDVCTLVKADLEARIAKGVETYGQRLRTNNGRDPLVDAYQECLDMSLYLRQAIEEIADLRQQLATERAARERAEAARDAALRQCSEWAAKCGEAEGKLAGSELAGVVRDWQERAEQAEARLAKVEALEQRYSDYLGGPEARFAAELEAALKS